MESKLQMELKRLGATLLEITSRDSDDTPLVLAMVPGVEPFVTWVWTGTGFVWGHYFTTEQAARDDWRKRALD